MTTMWGVHNDQPQLDLIDNGFVSIGRAEMGDLSVIGNDREAMKAKVRAAFPDAKPGAIPNIAGTLLTFAYRMLPGDLVVYPHRPDSTLNFGRIESEYYYEAGAPLHRNRRKVTWLKTGVPRTTLSKTARYEVGSAVTVFQVKRHTHEFLAFIGGEDPGTGTPPTVVPPEEAVEVAADEPNAERIETYTRDFIIEKLMKSLEGVQFEHFVAHVLEAMGYRTKVTQASGDGGFDIIAHRDPLGLEPPIIKVQCKRTTGSMGGPEVQRLIGTLASGNTELGLFVTLGAYLKDASISDGRGRTCASSTATSSWTSSSSTTSSSAPSTSGCCDSVRVRRGPRAGRGLSAPALRCRRTTATSRAGCCWTGRRTRTALSSGPLALHPLARPSFRLAPRTGGRNARRADAA